MALPFKKIKKDLDFLDTLGFGNKYMGKTISYIIEFDPEYLDWCCKKANLVYLTDKCHNALEDRLVIVRKAKEDKLLAKLLKPPKSKSKELWYAHADQDDWWDDVPF